MKGFLYYVLIFFLAGIGPALYFFPLFHKKNVLRAVALALGLGSIFFNLTVLTFGHLGFQIAGRSLTLISAGVVLTSLCIASLTFRSNALPYASIAKEYRASFAKRGFWKEFIFGDLLGFIAVALLFIFALKVNFRHFFPSWDHFTYWLVDAKGIFDTGALRTTTRLISDFDSTSYYPLHAHYIFDWYGRAVEQPASLFTIFYAALASLLIYSQTAGRSIACKIATGFLVFIVNYSLFGYYPTFYADIINAFLITFFFFILLEKQPGNEAKRIFLLLLTLLTFSYIKTTNIYYVYLLLVPWVFHDFPINPKLRKQLLRVESAVFIAILFSVIAARFYYRAVVWPFSIPTPQLVQLDNLGISFESRVQFADTLFDLLLSEYSLLFAGLVFVVAAISLVKPRDNAVQALLIAILILPAINVGDYLFSLYPLRSRSLLRYVSTIFFLIPMIIPLLESYFKASKFTVSILTAAYLTVAVGAAVSLSSTYNIGTLPVHSGEYKDFRFQRETYLLAQKVKTASQGDTLLIATANAENITNSNLLLLQLRYYLSKQVVGGTYNASTKEFLEMVRRDNVKYILVNEMNDFMRSLFKASGLGDSPTNSKEHFRLYKILQYEPFASVELPLPG